jgi:hypothetical protein
MEMFLFMLHQQGTLYTRFLNSVKRQELCVINVRRDVNVAHRIRAVEAVEHGRQKQETEEKVCQFSTTD